MSGDADNTLYLHPELYDLEFAGYRADARFYGEVVRDHPGLVVEPGCGTGRLWGLLQPRRYVGLDGAAAMVRQGARRTAHLPAHQRPTWARADLRALPLADRTAHVVMLAYNLLQHMRDEPSLVACLREARRVLHEDGVVAMDTFMPPRPGTERVEREFGWFEERTGPDGRVWRVGERTVQEEDTGVQRTELSYRARDGSSPERVVTFTRRAWSVPVLLDAITAASLRLERAWGDVDGRPWREDSPRFMAVCRRG